MATPRRASRLAGRVGRSMWSASDSACTAGAAARAAKRRQSISGTRGILFARSRGVDTASMSTGGRARTPLAVPGDWRRRIATSASGAPRRCTACLAGAAVLGVVPRATSTVRALGPISARTAWQPWQLGSATASACASRCISWAASAALPSAADPAAAAAGGNPKGKPKGTRQGNGKGKGKGERKRERNAKGPKKGHDQRQGTGPRQAKVGGTTEQQHLPEVTVPSTNEEWRGTLASVQEPQELLALLVGARRTQQRLPYRTIVWALNAAARLDAPYDVSVDTEATQLLNASLMLPALKNAKPLHPMHPKNREHARQVLKDARDDELTCMAWVLGSVLSRQRKQRQPHAADRPASETERTQFAMWAVATRIADDDSALASPARATLALWGIAQAGYSRYGRDVAARLSAGLVDALRSDPAMFTIRDLQRIAWVAGSAQSDLNRTLLELVARDVVRRAPSMMPNSDTTGLLMTLVRTQPKVAAASNAVLAVMEHHVGPDATVRRDATEALLETPPPDSSAGDAPGAAGADAVTADAVAAAGVTTAAKTSSAAADEVAVRARFLSGLLWCVARVPLYSARLYSALCDALLDLPMHDVPSDALTNACFAVSELYSSGPGGGPSWSRDAAAGAHAAGRLASTPDDKHGRRRRSHTTKTAGGVEWNVPVAADPSDGAYELMSTACAAVVQPARGALWDTARSPFCNAVYKYGLFNQNAVQAQAHVGRQVAKAQPRYQSFRHLSQATSAIEATLMYVTSHPLAGARGAASDAPTAADVRNLERTANELADACASHIRRMARSNQAGHHGQRNARDRRESEFSAVSLDHFFASLKAMPAERHRRVLCALAGAAPAHDGDTDAAADDEALAGAKTAAIATASSDTADKGGRHGGALDLESGAGALNWALLSRLAMYVGRVVQESYSVASGKGTHAIASPVEAASLLLQRIAAAAAVDAEGLSLDQGASTLSALVRFRCGPTKADLYSAFTVQRARELTRAFQEPVMRLASRMVRAADLHSLETLDGDDTSSGALETRLTYAAALLYSQAPQRDGGDSAFESEAETQRELMASLSPLVTRVAPTASTMRVSMMLGSFGIALSSEHSSAIDLLYPPEGDAAAALAVSPGQLEVLQGCEAGIQALVDEMANRADSMTPHVLSLAAYHVSALGYMDQSLFERLLNSLSLRTAHVANEDAQRLYQVHVGCALERDPRVQTDPDAADYVPPPSLPRDLVTSFAETAASNNRRFMDEIGDTTKLTRLPVQHAVTMRALRHMGIDAEAEVWIPETGHSVDIAIPGTKVVVEVQGPRHYSVMGTGRMVPGTCLKNRHLRAAGYDVVNVPWIDFQELLEKHNVLSDLVSSSTLREPALLDVHKEFGADYRAFMEGLVAPRL